MSIEARLNKLVARKDANTTAAVEKFKERMSGVVSRLDSRIQKMVRTYAETNNLENLDLGFALHSRAELQSALTEVGYFDAVDEFMGGYSGVIDGVVEQYRLFDTALSLSPTSVEVIKQLQQFDINFFQNLGNQTTETLYRALYEHTLTPVPFESVVSVVRGTLEGTALQKYSYTYANDTIMRFERSVNAITAEETGWTKVKYIGPADAVTRPFCMAHVGKEYTKEEAQAMKNDFGRSAWVEGGGYNCRHSWVAVP